MARKAVVDKEVILDMLKAGETTQRIADHFNVSRQAIDLHRKDFISRGMLEDKRANRKRTDDFPTTESEAGTNGQGTDLQPHLIPSTRIYQADIESQSLDNHIDLLISAFSALKRLPQIEQELAIYKQENEKVRRELTRLKDRERKRIEQENRWMLIQDEPQPSDETGS